MSIGTDKSLLLLLLLFLKASKQRIQYVNTERKEKKGKKNKLYVHPQGRNSLLSETRINKKKSQENGKSIALRW